MATKKAKLEKTKTPGVYRRGKKYVYAYRVRGVQRWKTVESYDEARRGKLAAEVDVERGVEWTPFDGHVRACAAGPRKDVSVDAENATFLSR